MKIPGMFLAQWYFAIQTNHVCLPHIFVPIDSYPFFLLLCKINLTVDAQALILVMIVLVQHTIVHFNWMVLPFWVVLKIHFICVFHSDAYPFSGVTAMCWNSVFPIQIRRSWVLVSADGRQTRFTDNMLLDFTTLWYLCTCSIK